jgi:hypothetical protein
MQKRKLDILIKAAVALVVMTYIIVKLIPPSPSSFFRRTVIDPIPGSVKEIKVDRYRSINERRWVLHFDLSEADLSLIVASRPFTELPYFEYREKYGSVSFGERDSGKAVPLYLRSGRPSPPDWFQLGQWDRPKAYVFLQERRLGVVRLLVYNKGLAEAYYIEYEVRD